MKLRKNSTPPCVNLQCTPKKTEKRKNKADIIHTTKIRP